MKRLAIFAILFFPMLLLVFWLYWGLAHSPTMTRNPSAKSVADRQQQYGPQVHARMQASFAAKQIAYPPARLVFAGFKQEKVLEVYAAATNQPLQYIRSYPIIVASGTPGPKLREGDLQVPEGIYPVESLNPDSKYHLSLRIGYPNVFDRQQAGNDGRNNLGGDIMIHGGAVSIGCLAMGDEAAEDLFVLAADTGISNITVVLSPVDFRKGVSAPTSDKLPAWTGSLYETIKAKLKELPQPPPP